MRIKDQKFLSRFSARFCRRGVRGRANQYALSRLHIEVQKEDDIGFVFSVCDSQGSLLDVAWNTAMAVPLRYFGGYAAISRCNRRALHSVLKRFLVAHGLMTSKGRPTERAA